MERDSLTPRELETLMDALCRTTQRSLLHDRGIALIRKALGANADAYLPAIDKWLQRVKDLGPERSYGPPTTQRIEQAARNGGMEGGAL